MKKTIITLFLLGIIAGLVYWLYSLFAVTVGFEQSLKERQEVVIERLKDIRTAQRSYRTKYGRFAGSFEDLIYFVNHDSLQMTMTIGSYDDSAAVAQGKVQSVAYMVAVKDTIFPKGFNIESIKEIPFSVEATGSVQIFKMDTTSIKTESSVTVPVFEAFASYKSFLGDLDRQELINYRDERINTLGKDDGLKVGSLTLTNNEAGNWE
ncbi:MAG: hypothetical protein R3Y19_02655 [Rikenellaceae bacterium]